MKTVVAAMTFIAIAFVALSVANADVKPELEPPIDAAAPTVCLHDVDSLFVYESWLWRWQIRGDIRCIEEISITTPSCYILDVGTWQQVPGRNRYTMAIWDANSNTNHDNTSAYWRPGAESNDWRLNLYMVTLHPNRMSENVTLTIDGIPYSVIGPECKED
jgi:hypothetical protein